MSLVLVLLAAWFVIAAFALILCLAARRTDREIASADLAPVIDLQAAGLAGRKHVA
jgi:hypothetical protein